MILSYNPPHTTHRTTLTLGNRLVISYLFYTVNILLALVSVALDVFYPHWPEKIKNVISPDGNTCAGMRISKKNLESLNISTYLRVIDEIITVNQAIVNITDGIVE